LKPVATDRLSEYFINRMDELVQAGLDFKSVAQETLRGVLGEGPSEVLIGFVGVAALKDARTFVTRLARVFSDGMAVICGLIIENGEASLASPVESSQISTFESLMREMKPKSAGEHESKGNYLHDHRKKDELDELVGHRTN
jgi:hypothetical protein